MAFYVRQKGQFPGNVVVGTPLQDSCITPMEEL
jgi:hypothetical protein